MGTSRQLFKRSEFYSLQNIEKLLMHALDAHLHCRLFDELILTVKTQSSSSANVVNDWLSLSLSCICKLHHADDMSSAVEAVEKVPLKLLPTINGFGFKIGVPVEGIFFKSLDKLFYQQIPSCTSSFTCFNEMSNVLFWVGLSIKLLELGWLVSIQHYEIVDPLPICLGIQRESLSRTTILIFNEVCNHLLQLLNRQ
ncbi:uncharacterized protein E5676_scaffold83G00230 [Cucumis melo var. makuwa]|uniref:Uncharacterized protein n=1 Tax=Cucumis melo var. makuwa TaxID=1194695 RepID=A0A5A7TF65_CUCMM|nr:uncharacterized protein E6C27_scaffold67G002120 [Cucumis melo var. makuwa]TYK05354.1 uncharacterized protein E5676_scaffold83G00230 [Cucumis melo var. makuwa]